MNKRLVLECEDLRKQNPKKYHKIEYDLNNEVIDPAKLATDIASELFDMGYTFKDDWIYYCRLMYIEASGDFSDMGIRRDMRRIAELSLLDGNIYFNSFDSLRASLTIKLTSLGEKGLIKINSQLGSSQLYKLFKDNNLYMDSTSYHEFLMKLVDEVRIDVNDVIGAEFLVTKIYKEALEVCKDRKNSSFSNAIRKMNT